MRAVLSACGRFRYRLERDVGLHGPVFAFFGVNPSTADASMDDATVRKWIGFTKVHGASRLLAGNAFAFRATDVDELAVAPDPVGPENDRHLAAIAAEADVLVACWGARRKLPPTLHARLGALTAFLQRLGKPLMCFGHTAQGDPKHPLMLSYGTQLVLYVAPGTFGASRPALQRATDTRRCSPCRQSELLAPTSPK